MANGNAKKGYVPKVIPVLIMNVCPSWKACYAYITVCKKKY